jgi:hypothetical protein
MKLTENNKGRTWHVLMTMLVFSICVKLFFSIVIKEYSEDQDSTYRIVYYLADLPVLFLSVFHIIVSRRYFKQEYYLKVMKTLFVMFVLVILAVVSSMSKGVSMITAVNSQLKIFLPILMLIGFNMFPYRARLNRGVGVMTILILLISIYAFLFLEPSRNRDAYYWPIYFSGLHTHAYVVFASFVFIHFYFFSIARMRKITLLVSFLFALILGYGYGVRTSLMCLVTYLFVFYANNGKWFLVKKSSILFGLSFLLIVFLFFIADNIDLLTFDGFSSGRLSEYVSRFEFIRNRDVMGTIFGSGAGSDIMYSETWWWEDKGSHNDYLTLIIEFGFLYLLLFLMFIRRLIKLFSGNFTAYGVFGAYLISSLISNGFMFRPMAAYVLFLSLISINVFLSNQVRQNGDESLITS